MTASELLMDRMTVLRYERSIGRLDEMSRTRRASPEDISAYAARIRAWSGFAHEVAAESSWRGSTRGLVTVRSDTPEALLRLGFENLPMMHTRAHLSMELSPAGYPYDGHGVEPSSLIALPELLEDPVAVYASPTAEGRVIAVLEEVSGPHAEPFVAVIDPDARLMTPEGPHAESNFILSAYGRHQVAREIPAAIQAGEALKVDPDRLERLFLKTTWRYNEYRPPTASELHRLIDSMKDGTRWNQLGPIGTRGTVNSL